MVFSTKDGKRTTIENPFQIHQRNPKSITRDHQNNPKDQSGEIVHNEMIQLFWVYRFTVHRRHAMMASMLASSILTVVLATLVASGGMASSPLYGLAFMQLGFAFFHPAVLASTTETE